MSIKDVLLPDGRPRTGGDGQRRVRDHPLRQGRQEDVAEGGGAALQTAGLGRLDQVYLFIYLLLKKAG